MKGDNKDKKWADMDSELEALWQEGLSRQACDELLRRIEVDRRIEPPSGLAARLKAIPQENLPASRRQWLRRQQLVPAVAAVAAILIVYLQIGDGVSSHTAPSGELASQADQTLAFLIEAPDEIFDDDLFMLEEM